MVLDTNIKLYVLDSWMFVNILKSCVICLTYQYMVVYITLILFTMEKNLNPCLMVYDVKCIYYNRRLSG